MKNKQKNSTIELYRFLFTCIIFIYHFRTYNGSQNTNGSFSGGYLGVEFFFVISGVFLMKSIDENNFQNIKINEELISFIKQKYRRLYPEYLISLLLLMFFSILFSDTYKLSKFIINGYPDLLCLQIFFLNKNINSLLWFVSALIWASFIIKVFMSVLGEKLFYFVGGLFTIIYFSFIYINIGHLNLTQNHHFYLDGFGRAFSELYIGSMLFKLSLNFHIEKFINSKILLFSKTICLFLILKMMFNEGNNRFDFLILICISVLIFLAIIKNTISDSWKSSLYIFLGSISYTMYLNQVLIQKIIHSLFPGYNFTVILLLSIVFLILISIFIHKFVKHFISQ